MLNRLVYIAYAQSTLITAAEALPLSDADFSPYGKVMVRHLRAMIVGRAPRIDEDGHHHSLKNSEVLKRWGIAPCKIEVMLRRVKMLQQMALNPAAHVQLIRALFGRWAWSASPLCSRMARSPLGPTCGHACCRRPLTC